MKLPISAFVICKDEADFIGPCIDSLHMCQEIIVVDSGSKDATLEIINRYISAGWPIKLMFEKWRGYGGQKQFALEQCTLDWCFSVDSDERISPKLAKTLPDLISTTEDLVAWEVTRFDYINGYGYVPPKSHERFHVRLFKRSKAWFDPTDIVHEGIHVSGPTKKAKIGGLLHFRSIRLEEEIQKKNKYSSLKAELKRSRGIKSKPIKMLFSPVMFFLRWYVGHGLWRCGWAGFIHAMNGAIYSFLTEAKRFEDEAMERVPPVEPSGEGY